METIEGNRLIAQFMGLRPTKIAQGAFAVSVSPYVSVVEDTEEKAMESLSRSLRYHSDWSWLMPVVEKIESLTQNSVTINKNNVRVWQITDNYIVNISLNEDGFIVSRYLDTDFDYTVITGEKQTLTKIESVWQAVVEFIKWYNTQKPEN